MGKMESAIRDEVSRLARREIRSAVGPMLKERARLVATPVWNSG